MAGFPNSRYGAQPQKAHFRDLKVAQFISTRLQLINFRITPKYSKR